jgi:hypothetical protein
MLSIKSKDVTSIEGFGRICRFRSTGFFVLSTVLINLSCVGHASEIPIRPALEFRKVVGARPNEANGIIESINVPDPNSSTSRSIYVERKPAFRIETTDISSIAVEKSYTLYARSPGDGLRKKPQGNAARQHTSIE